MDSPFCFDLDNTEFQCGPIMTKTFSFSFARRSAAGQSVVRVLQVRGEARFRGGGRVQGSGGRR